MESFGYIPNPIAPNKLSMIVASSGDMGTLTGGALGAHQLLVPGTNKPITIPKNSKVLRIQYVMKEALTSGGAATVALGTSAAPAAFIAATAYGSWPSVVGAPSEAFVTPVSITADGTLQYTVAGDVLTAGEFVAYVFLE